eukprot:1149978-Pelagomonas_calceolata.AAC.3
MSTLGRVTRLLKLVELVWHPKKGVCSLCDVCNLGVGRASSSGNHTGKAQVQVCVTKGSKWTKACAACCRAWVVLQKGRASCGEQDSYVWSGCGLDMGMQCWTCSGMLQPHTYQPHQWARPSVTCRHNAWQAHMHTL